jgi:hypothetical protein
MPEPAASLPIVLAGGPNAGYERAARRGKIAVQPSVCACIGVACRLRLAVPFRVSRRHWSEVGVDVAMYEAHRATIRTAERAKPNICGPIGVSPDRVANTQPQNVRRGLSMMSER